MQRVRHANRGRLLLRTPGPVPFGTYMCSNVETNLSWICLVSGLLNFEHPSVLLFCSFDWSIFLSIMESWKLIPLKTYVLCIGILLCWHTNDFMFWAYLRTQQNYASIPLSRVKHGPLSTLLFPGLRLPFKGIVRYWVEACLPTIFPQIIILYYDLYMSSVQHVSCKYTLNHLLSRLRKQQYALTTEKQLLINA